MINFPPTVTICRNIFHDINTWLDLNNMKDIKIVSIFISSRAYILNFNTSIEYKEVVIPIEDIIKISKEKNKEFQLKQLKELNLL